VRNLSDVPKRRLPPCSLLLCFTDANRVPAIIPHLFAPRPHDHRAGRLSLRQRSLTVQPSIPLSNGGSAEDRSLEARVTADFSFFRRISVSQAVHWHVPVAAFTLTGETGYSFPNVKTILGGGGDCCLSAVLFWLFARATPASSLTERPRSSRKPGQFRALRQFLPLPFCPFEASEFGQVAFFENPLFPTRVQSQATRCGNSDPVSGTFFCTAFPPRDVLATCPFSLRSVSPCVPAGRPVYRSRPLRRP